jgi:hypothetical protein
MPFSNPSAKTQALKRNTVPNVLFLHRSSLHWLHKSGIIDRDILLLLNLTETGNESSRYVSHERRKQHNSAEISRRSSGLHSCFWFGYLMNAFRTVISP